MIRPSDEQIKAAEENQRRMIEENYQATNLEAMSDKALAQWQSQQKTGSREAILGEQQWKIRLLNRQLRNARWLGAVGCLSGLAGVVLGYYLRALDVSTLPPHGVVPEKPPDTHTEKQTP